MILTDVYIPSLDETYDFLLDEHAMTEQIIQELVGIVLKKTNSARTGDEHSFMLIHKEQKKILHLDETLYEGGIRDGSRLILV